MVDVDKAVIARLTSHGQHFEILVDCDAALAVKEGKPLEIRNVLAAMKIFSDAHKGMEVSEKQLEGVFNTSNIEEAAAQIIKKGEVQLTQEHREKLRDQKWRQIVSMIHVNGVDPKTHNPHPPERIETALRDIKFHVDEFHSVQQQVQDALKKLKVVLPIKFEIKQVEVKIGPNYAGKTYPIVKKFGTLLKDEWMNNGYWHGLVEIPGGLEADLYDKLNDATHGEVEVNVVKVK